MQERQVFEKVAYIVPSEQIQRLTEQALCKEREEGWLDVMQMDPYHIKEKYEELIQDGYGCIIARGGTYHEIKSLNPSVPIVEERIHTADILEMITDFFQVKKESVYVVLHTDVAYGFENLETLAPDRVRVLRYENIEELKRVLQSIPEEDVYVFTSGVASKVVKRKDLKLIEIRNREHTLRTSARYAYNLLEQMRSNITQLSVMNSVYNNVDEGIIIFRPDNIVTEINRQGENMLHLPSDSVIGQDIYDLIPGMPPKKKDGTCSVETPTVFMSEISGRKLNFSIYPFDFFHGDIRNMVIVQDVTRIQEAERKIRMELSKKGLVAEWTFDDIYTQDPKMEHVVNRARRIATFEGSVLIYGESGTGKEMFAQSIHNASRRRNGPFVAVNCGALTESLLESELFGYVGGSFTGARKEGKAGLFELAHRGTIFLDEINSTTMSMQTKILRVLEERQVMRVGSDYVIPLDIRVISASNSNLSEDVEKGDFRRDLFFRLNTFRIELPPIRERVKDIVPLFKLYVEQNGGKNVKLNSNFVHQLETYPWLGNVRELRSVALRYFAFDGDNSGGDILQNDAHDPLKASLDKQGRQSEEENGLDMDEEGTVSLGNLSRVVEQLVIESLEGKGLSKSEIAKKMGISRQALYRKIKRQDENDDEM